MRLARKFIVAVALVVFAVMGLAAFVALRREIGHFEADMRRDHQVMAQMMASAIQRVWRADGRGQAEVLVHAANLNDEGVALRWVVLPAPPGDPRAPVVDAKRLAPLLQGQQVMLEAEAGLPRQVSRRRLFTYVPLTPAGDHVEALELSESFALEDQFTRAAAVDAAMTTVIMALLCALLAAVLGVWLVGSPIARLVQKARRVGAGELLDPLVLSGNDELSELAQEMNLMCERLTDAHRKLDHEHEERIRALEQLRHADRLSTVGKLASGLAHELGTPLNVIGGRAKMIQQGEVDGDEAQRCARIVVEQAQSMTRIIRQLLDFARQRTPSKAPDDLRRIATQTVGLLAPLAEKKGVRLEVAAGGAPLIAAVDGAQVQQAITNLVINAIQATGEGGAITVGLAQERLQPPADCGGGEGDYLRLSVEDTGSGIAPDHLAHVFEPFFTTKGVGEGTGLGLSVAYGIVREHGGWIGVQSEPGKGSRFSLYLPPKAAVSRP